MYIEINKDLIPYSFEIELDGNIYRFLILYNNLFDYFTIDLYLDDEPVLYGEKLSLDNELFKVIKYKDMPSFQIIPKDLSNLEVCITFENLNEEIFLYLVGDNNDV